MKNALRIFFNSDGTKPYFVLLCLLVAGFLEGISLGTILPVMTELFGSGADESHMFTGFIFRMFANAGIEPSLQNMWILVFGGLCLKSVLVFGALAYVGCSAAEVASQLRIELLNKVFNARWSYFTDQRVGRIANAISNDATRSGLAYSSAANFLAATIQGAVYVVTALYISPWLAILSLAVGITMVLSLRFLIRISRAAAYKQTDRTSELVTDVSDMLGNIKPVVTMHRQAPYFRSFTKKLTGLKKSLRKQSVAREALSCLRQLMLFSLLGVAAYLVLSWKVPAPELVVMTILFIKLVGAIGRAQMRLQRAAELESAYTRFKSMVHEAGEREEINAGTCTPMLTEGCRFENVAFSHGDAVGLRGVTFDIPVGGITVLRGASGAGKTTLIDLLTGLHMPQGGDILIDGTPIHEVDLNHWRSLIGYVPQDLSLFNETILHNVTLGDEGLTGDDAREALKQADAWEFVSSLPEGLDTMVGERGFRLSGGQRQRVALARALITKPKLLILDEVTSALDPETEQEICRNVQALMNDYTIVVITHGTAWTDIATALYQVDAGTVERADLTGEDEAPASMGITAPALDPTPAR